MIKYLLKCKNKHEFESLFSDSEEYEKLKKKNLIDCIFCKSHEVEKSIMSPNIIGKNKIKNKKLNNNQFLKIKKDLVKIKKYIEKNFEFVGNKLPQKVREIYYDKQKSKNIYGTASVKDREELEEEGIELTSIPWIDRKEN